MTDAKIVAELAAKGTQGDWDFDGDTIVGVDECLDICFVRSEQDRARLIRVPAMESLIANDRMIKAETASVIEKALKVGAISDDWAWAFQDQLEMIRDGEINDRLDYLEKESVDLSTRNAELEARIAELEEVLDSSETDCGITSNGNMWRFWAQKSKELAGKNAELEAENARLKTILDEVLDLENLPYPEAATAWIKNVCEMCRAAKQGEQQ